MPRVGLIALVPLALACEGSTDPKIPPAPTTVARTVPAAPGARPFGVAVSRSGAVLVTSQDDGMVRRFDLPSYALGGEIQFQGNVGDVAFHPSGATAFAISVGTGTLGRLVVGGDDVAGSVTFPGSAYRVRLTPDGGTVLATSDGRLNFVSPASLAVLGSVVIPGTPNGLAVPAAGGRAYVSTNEGTLYEVNLSTRAVVRSVPLRSGTLAQEVVVARDGSEIYVANEGSLFGPATGWSYVVNAQTFALADSFPVTGFGMALTSDGSHLLISTSRTGQLHVVNRVSRSLVRSIGVGGVPRRIAVRGADVLVANENGNLVVLR